jgi:hypothetical protein
MNWTVPILSLLGFMLFVGVGLLPNARFERFHVDGPVPTGIRVALCAVGVGLLCLSIYTWQAELDKGKPEPTASLTAPPSVPNGSSAASSPPVPSTAPLTDDGVRYQRTFTIPFIENTGWLDLDEPRVWRGDEDENQEAADVGFSPKRVTAKGTANVAVIPQEGMSACSVKFADPQREITMGQVENDKGFCARSKEGVFAHIELVQLVTEDGDSTAEIRVTAYH